MIHDTWSTFYSNSISMYEILQALATILAQSTGLISDHIPRDRYSDLLQNKVQYLTTIIVTIDTWNAASLNIYHWESDQGSVPVQRVYWATYRNPLDSCFHLWIVDRRGWLAFVRAFTSNTVILDKYCIFHESSTGMEIIIAHTLAYEHKVLSEWHWKRSSTWWL